MSNDTVDAVATSNSGGTPVKRGRAPKMAKPVTDGAPTIAKRGGRPAAPQTRGEALTAYLTKLQAARKALADARAILLKLPDLEPDGTEVNWYHHPALVDDLFQVDYRLHAAQQVIHASDHDAPTDKL